jgi:hypothetical protein
MQCHICGEPATGQCQSCSKFYCASHGDVMCDRCPRGGAPPRFSVPVVGQGLAGVDDESVQGIVPGFMRGDALRGVVAIAEVRHVEGADVSLLSLESYDDGFLLHWRITRRSATAPARADFPFGGSPNVVFSRVTDDLGGEYQGGFGGGGGDDRHWRGEETFTPAIADGATRLEFRIEGVQLTSWMTGARSTVTTEPWDFAISLASMKAVSS